MSNTIRSRQMLAVAAVVGVLVAGCGTRVADDRIISAEGGAAGVAVPAGATSTGETVVAATTESGPAVAALTPQGAAAQGTAATNSAPEAAASAGGQSAAAKGSTPQVASGPNAPCTTKLAPIVIGQTLVSSGVVGAALGNLRLGLNIWAQAVNARGGVQCHPVQVYSMDDGSDPARVQSNMNELVNNKGAVAILAAGDPIPDTALQSSAERLKVPVIGGDLNSVTWTKSPYLFPQGGGAFASYAGGIKEAGEAFKGRRAGLMYCVEANICSAIAGNWDQIAQWGGLAQGAAKAVSITATDYTAECQVMKNDGVDTLLTAVDGSAVSRIVRSCAALGYRPAIVTPALAINPQVAADPNAQKNTLWLGTSVIPFNSTDTPAGKEFNQDAARYAPGTALDQSTVMGWVSGKLFAAAMGKVHTDTRTQTVTSATVLKGLGLIKNETLNGAAPPLTFTAGKPTPPTNCYYIVSVSEGGFRAPKGGRMSCF
ncbi:ABC transporter substrate-binding protein [Sporichthya sp.]|uniref:ABC transporter substrate-binding protein n=1 Tax=Sporichthya sp. TaxID=65475 RepID=UPI0017C405E8|nr:ABC transporter substrate-binding protein [Sporichthya sp.]MBA3741636.1 ABC transporter substrate-binding protein [Sporichthya sp.]